VAEVTNEAEGRLVSLTVSEFVARVASTAEAVPAGGSVSALVGASSAALLALAAGVLVHRGVADAEGLRTRAEALQTRLLAMVDADATAYHAFLEDKRAPNAIMRMADVPLEIAAACGEAQALADEVAERITGSIGADVRAAHRMAQAAHDAALELAEANLPYVRDELQRDQLRGRLADLRG